MFFLLANITLTTRKRRQRQLFAMIPTFVASFVAVAKVFIEWRPPTCTFKIASACSRGKSEHVWIYSLNLDIWDIRIVCKCQILTTSWVKSLCIVKFSLCDFNPKDLGMVYIYIILYNII